MKRIRLTKGKFALIDDEDLKLVSQYSWYYNNGRAMHKNKEAILMHRLILNFPKGQVIDHINGNGLDNRKKNLRICSQAENLKNMRISKSNKSGQKGVHRHSQNPVWIAQISVDNTTIYLGSHKSKKKATEAYAKASKKYHGKFGRLK